MAAESSSVPTPLKFVSKKPLTWTQFFALVGAHVSAVTLFALAVVWAATKNEGKNIKRQFYLGGLGASRAKVFNWHPVLMVAAFGLCMTQAILAFRTLPLGKAVNKALHAGWHTLAVICFSFGLAAVWRSHDKPVARDGSHLADLYTPHAMVGLGVVALASLQYVTAAIAFLAPRVGAALKANILPNHVLLGVVVYVASVAAIVSGASEAALARLGCGYYTNSVDKDLFDDDKSWHGANKYALDDKDSDPAEHYHYLPDGCKVGAGVGVMALITLLFTLGAVLSLKVGPESDVLAKPVTSVTDALLTSDDDGNDNREGVGLA